MNDYLEVSEITGNMVAKEQLIRMEHRYLWAKSYAQNKDVVELACGTGQGLGMLKRVSKSLVAGDYSERMIHILRSHYGSTINVDSFDACKMPYENQSKDLIVLFEAIYYLPDLDSFFRECRRVLRKNGKILICTPNIYLYDFVPSEYTFDYFQLETLEEMKKKYSLTSEIYGYFDYGKTTLWQRILRPVKKIVFEMNLMPKTMTGKQFIRSFVFGRLSELPPELSPDYNSFQQPERITENFPSFKHKVLYYELTINDQ